MAYISQRNPDDEIFFYGKCLFVASIDNELKIIKNYTFKDNILNYAIKTVPNIKYEIKFLEQIKQ